MRGSPFRALAVAVAFVLLLTLLFSARFVREMADFEVYWRAAARAASAEPLYREDDGHFQFKYLPAFAVLAMPVASLPLQRAKTIWFAASLGCLLGLIALSLRLPGARRKPTWLLVAVILVVMGKFFGHELVLGQVNLLFGVTAVAALLALKRNADVAAGALLALAVVVKPYAVILLPWLAAQRRLTALVVAGASLAAALVLPTITYGPEETVQLHREWWTTVTASTAPNLLNQDNVSIAAMFAKWLGPGALASAFTAAAAAALLVVAGWVFLRRKAVDFPAGLEGALLLTMVPLLSPQGWDYVFLIATPAVVYLANFGDRLPRWLAGLTWIALATIGLSLFDVLGRTGYARFMAWSIITLCFLVVIGGLVALRLRQVA